MVRLWKRDLRGKLGICMGVGVVARVSMVGVLLLSLLLLLLVLLLLSLFCLCLMCLGGCHRGARLVERSREWGLIMLLWPISLPFYPPVGVSHDIFLSVVELRCYWWAPTYCCFLGIPSTWLGIVVCIDYIDGLESPRLCIVLHPRSCQVVVSSNFRYVPWFWRRV
jgi:hypothetical protein